ncbi:hypothetical protein HYFRA_00005533 [Hymenoscyphus fraxineus]|uniref:Uncharacterized protein n=1 Tax=Hymenoscyphus fraxineus TaxID=746836 RepID=A0A9N9KUG3_9HELO|nr:hypothetical protein HYFRA_00005533 [Hymenoscyphus fraxineus]
MSSPPGGQKDESVAIAPIMTNIPSEILTAQSTPPVMPARPSIASTASTPAAATPSDSTIPPMSAEIKGIIAVSVVAGVAVLTLITILIIMFVHRRNKRMKKEMIAEKHNTMESGRRGSGINRNFKGVPFGQLDTPGHSRGMSSPAPSSAYLLGAPSPDPGAAFSPTILRHQQPTPTPEPEYRVAPPSPSNYSSQPQASIRVVPSDPSLLFKYENGQQSSHTGGHRPGHSRQVSELTSYATLGRLDTGAGTFPLPPLGNFSQLDVVSPQTAIELETPIDQQTSNFFGRASGTTRDTMGFPVDIKVPSVKSEVYPDLPELSDRRPSAAPEPLFHGHGSGDYGSMASPQPTRPGYSKDTLERAVRERMAGTPSPAPSTLLLANQNFSRNLTHGSRMSGGVTKLLDEELKVDRESPVLGVKNPVVIKAVHPKLEELRRHQSQRTVDSMESVISDTELERLGVGIARV